MDRAKRTTLIGTAAAATALAMPAVARAQEQKPSLLFISVDDLNDFPSPFGGYPGIVTPNFDRLASMGTVFSNACAHVPACSPSRTATLLGTAATRTGVYYNNQSWKQVPGELPTLPGYLRANGWITRGGGKVFHRGNKDLRASDWDEFYRPLWAKLPPISETAKENPEDILDFGPHESGGLGDKAVVEWAVSRSSPEPTFLAVGFIRPHLPLIVPQEFFDLYPANPALPPGFFPGADQLLENQADLADVGPSGRTTSHPERSRNIAENEEYDEFLRGYLASVSFVDHHLGVLLDAYEAGAFGTDTYIVLWSDHGWQLGEKLAISKFTLWERALRVPFIVVGPKVRQQIFPTSVSLLDVYPTICGLLGMPVPAHCDGQSLVPALFDAIPPLQRYALSAWGDDSVDPGSYRIYQSLRSKNWRLIDYGDGEVELYDHRVDPFEWRNVAGQYPKVVARLQPGLAPNPAPPVPEYVLPKD